MPKVLLIVLIGLLFFPVRAEAEQEAPLFSASAAQSIALMASEGPPSESAIVPRSAAVQPIELPAPAPSPSWYRSTWVWVGAGAVVAVVGTGLLLAYGTRDRYPSPGFGRQTIGAGQ